MMKIFEQEQRELVTMQLRVAALFIATVVAVGCGSKPQNSVNTSQNGTKPPLFTVISKREIRATSGARIEPVVSKDGSVHEIRIIALNNSGSETKKCTCEISACSGSCTASVAGLGATCDGSCSNSEQNPCGGCSFSDSFGGETGTGI